MVAEYKCSAINANLKATVGQLSEIEPLVAASNVCLCAREEDAWAAGQLAASDSASEGGAAADRVMAYLGDHQVKATCSLMHCLLEGISHFCPTLDHTLACLFLYTIMQQLSAVEEQLPQNVPTKVYGELLAGSCGATGHCPDLIHQK